MKKKIFLMLKIIFPVFFIDSLQRLYRWFKKVHFQLILKRVQFDQKKALKKIRKKAESKKKIKVVFFLIHESVWKYDGVYTLFRNHVCFDPVVVVCPYVVYGDEVMQREMNQAYAAFKSKGYTVLKSYNNENDEWLDVKREIKPDIVFFTNPYNLTDSKYNLNNYLKYLTCYVPYNFGNSHLFRQMYDGSFHNMLWKLFAETPIHKEYSEKYARNKGKNVEVTGFPGTDVLINKGYIPKDPWKKNKLGRKRIIWAPHHTIDNNTSFLSYSTFLIYADFMIRLAKIYNNDIQIAFKPHPILINKLNNEPGWGKERTDNYYNQWNDLENGQLENGHYLDLFLTSDAMIHDSGSFLIEYLYTGKPVLHTNRDDNIRSRMNSFGILAFNQHYHAKNECDIKEFIEMVVNDKDDKKEGRLAFFNSYLLPPNNKSASENIFNEIVKSLRMDEISERK